MIDETDIPKIETNELGYWVSVMEADLRNNPNSPAAPRRKYMKKKLQKEINRRKALYF